MIAEADVEEHAAHFEAVEPLVEGEEVEQKAARRRLLYILHLQLRLHF